MFLSESAVWALISRNSIVLLSPVLPTALILQNLRQVIIPTRICGTSFACGGTCHTFVVGYRSVEVISMLGEE